MSLHVEAVGQQNFGINVAPFSQMARTPHWVAFERLRLQGSISGSSTEQTHHGLNRTSP
jgi:hypothetical protein